MLIMAKRYTVQFYTTQPSVIKITNVTASNQSDARNQVKKRFASNGVIIHVVSVTEI